MKRASAARCPPLALFALLLALASAARAAPAEYEATTGAAIEEYAAGRFEEALALFARAHALAPSARTLRGLGMASFEVRRYADSIRYLEAALDDARKPLTAAQRRDAEQLIERARTFVVRLRLALTPADAEVTVDGHALAPVRGVLLLDSGNHEVVITAPGYEPAIRSVQWPAGSEAELRLQLSPPAEAARSGAPAEVEELARAAVTSAPTQSERSRFFRAKYGLLGVSTGAIVGTGVAIALREDRARAIERSCTDYVPNGKRERECPKLYDSGRTLRGLAIGGGVLTAALAVSTALLFVLDGPAEGTRARAFRSCTLGATREAMLQCQVPF